MSASATFRRAVLKPSKYGQPLAVSHPHLLKQGQLTPGILAEEYESRRKKLIDSLPDDSLVVSVAAPVKYMSANIFYKYRQASDFWYLTGFDEPDSAFIIEKSPSSSRGYKMHLFSTGKDTDKEKWDGASTTFTDAASIFRADSASSISSFPTHLKSLLPHYSNIYIDLPQSVLRPRSPQNNSKSLLRFLSSPLTGKSEYETVVDAIATSRRCPLAPQVAKLRAIKSPAEQSLLRAAADISGRAHAKTMRFTRPGISESALAAHFEYLCSLSGAQRLAYVPVVASGPNALIIHYTSNNHIVEEDEMILIDAGCEYNGYASDITRSYPVSGKFTPPQKDLYSAILSAQKTLISLCTSSESHSLMHLHRKSCDLLRTELRQLGFNFPPGNNDLERILYPHLLSHPIGIDLHESTHFDRNAPLKPGMVLTIEPGIYVPPLPIFPKHFHDIGIRIEDEVLIGEDNPIVLSVNAPKEIADIEGACQGLLGLEPY